MLRVVVFALLIAYASSTHAGPVVVGFSFDGDLGSGNKIGAVSGRIFGLMADGVNQQATSILIESFPDDPSSFFTFLPGEFEEGNDVVLWETVLSNEFSLVAGTVTAAQVSARSTSDRFGFRIDVFRLNRPGINQLGRSDNLFSLNNTNGAVANNRGLDGITFTVTPLAGVPTPGTLTLLGLGLVSLSLARRKTINSRARDHEAAL